MRVLCGNCVIEMNCALCNGKKLILETYDGKHYYTDDYYSENIAMCTLSDLVVNGYVRVNRLHIKEDF